MTGADSEAPMADQGLTRRFDDLYEQYVKPVESQYHGKYVAVAPDGRMVFGESRYEVVKAATEVLGSDSCIYKVGVRVVGSWR
jgi:hypothetical protein